VLIARFEPGGLIVLWQRVMGVLSKPRRETRHAA